MIHFQLRLHLEIDENRFEGHFMIVGHKLLISRVNYADISPERCMLKQSDPGLIKQDSQVSNFYFNIKIYQFNIILLISVLSLMGSPEFLVTFPLGHFY